MLVDGARCLIILAYHATILGLQIPGEANRFHRSLERRLSLNEQAIATGGPIAKSAASGTLASFKRGLRTSLYAATRVFLGFMLQTTIESDIRM